MVAIVVSLFMYLSLIHISIGEYVSIEELNEMYEMIEELPDYIVECLDEFISHYGTLEEVVEHKDDIYYYPDCETMTDVAYYYICLLYTSRCV